MPPLPGHVRGSRPASYHYLSSAILGFSSSAFRIVHIINHACIAKRFFPSRTHIAHCSASPCLVINASSFRHIHLHAQQCRDEAAPSPVLGVVNLAGVSSTEVTETGREVARRGARGEAGKMNQGLARMTTLEGARIHLVVRGDLPLVHIEDRTAVPVSLVHTTPRPFSRALVVPVYHHLRRFRYLQDNTLKIPDIKITPWTPRID